MHRKFIGKKVFVTGAACGIGYEICRSFVSEGSVVGLNSRSKESSMAAVEKIKEEFGDSHVSACPADIADLPKIKEAIKNFTSENNGLDVFVANAGITVFERFIDVEVDKFLQLMNVNMCGTYFSVQAAAREMISRNIAGRIILISSVCGVQAHRNTSAYGMTKAAIIQLARSLSEELGDYGITVNVVAPGATTSERTLEDAEYVDGWKSVAPGRSVGSPADVAHATLFLADAKSSHITGETLMIDGGWTVTSPLPKHLEMELKPQ